MIAGSAYLVGGCDSYTQPTALGPTEVVMGMNVTCRGGSYRTRPGTRILANLSGDNAQGGTFFVPTNGGTSAYVVAVDGKIYVAGAPYRTFIQLAGLQFNPLSRFVNFTICEQSTDYDVGGNLYFLAVPKTILIMQDGVTRAAYWDGVTHGHIDPTPSGGLITAPGYDGTMIGLWSVWSNNRLWVSRANQVFASDIGNPLKFTEAQYINEARAFYLAGDCTGMIETPDKDGILAFTEKDATLFLSSIQDRTVWLDTPNFQKTVLPSSGCVAPRSLINQYGLTWWFSSTGLQNLNSAMNQNVSSKIDYQDNEMAISKQGIGQDMSRVTAGNYENYLMMSVPSGDPYNRHTWVLDQQPFEGGANSWPGYWTGWRPLQWSKAVVGGRERVFFISRDYDDVNRLWEAFLPDRQDNGCAITCSLQTKQENFGTMLRKKFNFSRAYVSQMLGHVAFRWWLLPEHGSPYDIGHKDMIATPGQVYNNYSYGGTDPNDNLMRPNRSQSRIIVSEDMPVPSPDCTTCGVERKDTDNEDYAFGLFMVWSGDMAVSAYQIYVLTDTEPERGRCEDDETGPRSVNFNGCGGLDWFPEGNVFGPTYTATATVCVASVGSSSTASSSTASSATNSSSTNSSSSGVVNPNVCSTVTKTSIISQADADRRSECAANFDASFRAGIHI